MIQWLYYEHETTILALTVATAVDLKSSSSTARCLTLQELLPFRTSQWQVVAIIRLDPVIHSLTLHLGRQTCWRGRIVGRTYSL